MCLLKAQGCSLPPPNSWHWELAQLCLSLDCLFISDFFFPDSEIVKPPLSHWASQVSRFTSMTVITCKSPEFIFFSPWFMWRLNLRAQGWAFFYPSFLELEMSWLAGLFRCLSAHVHVMEWGSLIQNPEIQKRKLKSLWGSESVSSVGWQDGCCTDIRGQLAGVLPFHHVDSRDRTQIIRLSRRHLDLLRHCVSPSSMFSDSLFYSLTQLDPA